MHKIALRSLSFIRGVVVPELRQCNATVNISVDWKMSGQKKINSFFQSPTRGITGSAGALKENRSNETTKRQSEEAQLDGDQLSKKCKLDANKNYETTSPPPDVSENAAAESKCLGEEDRLKIEENRLLAKMKIAATKTRGLVVKIHPSWYKALEPEFAKPYFSTLANFVEEERKKYTVYPSADEVFSWTCITPVKETKVVILGQDPYHGVNQAHGLCFSVKKGIVPPPSLENMYKELLSDINGFVHPKHGCLSGWAEQGVLLLNAVLTVRAHNANSHKDRGWEKFTDAVISHLNKNSHGIVFILWGSYAQKKGSQIDKKKHHVIQGLHPSPLSAHRGFFGCKHFSRCNELLVQEGKTPINWSHLP